MDLKRSISDPRQIEALFYLARQVRNAESDKALQFLLVNQTLRLTPYLLAALWIEDEGIVIQSGVSHIEKNSPYILWLNDICKSLVGQLIGEITPEMLTLEQAKEWGSYLPTHACWIPINEGKRKAALILARETSFSTEEIDTLNEWMDIWTYSWVKLDAPSVHGELTRIWNYLLSKCPSHEDIKKYTFDVFAGINFLYKEIRRNPICIWRFIKCKLFHIQEQIKLAYKWIRVNKIEGLWEVGFAEGKLIWKDQKRRWKWIFWIFILFPVRLTVLVPGELVPANPAIIRVPFEGVVDEFYVAPNQQVSKGQPLFRLDITSLLSRSQVAQQEIQIATQEYRQSALQALTDAKSRGMLVPQEGKAAEKRVEAEYLKEMLEKAKIDAPRSGIVIFDDPSEWVGRPVAAGEKVMVVTGENDVEIEAWIPVGEAIELPKKSSVTLYLNAMPFSPISGTLRYEGHEPLLRPDGSYAYRVRAKLEPGEKGSRVGLKGTAKLHGQFVPLSYWVLRRPLSTLRQFLGI